MSTIAVPHPAPRASAPFDRPSVRAATPAAGARPVARHAAPDRVLSWPVVVALVVVLVGALAFAAQYRSVVSVGDRVDGHVMVEPGGSLWDVAIASVPPGGDPAVQLAEIQRLNGLSGARVDAWTVVLLPAS